MWAGFSFSQWITLHGLVTLVTLLVYVISSHAMLLRRSPAAAIAWVLFILSMPYLALPAYLVFGSRKRRRVGTVAIPDTRPAGRGGDWAIQTSLALGQPPPDECRDLHIHADGADARVALLEMIAAARHSIDLCTFILRRDVIGEAVMDRLCEQARSGVAVRVLVDGLGRLMAAGPDMRRLVDAGGTWAAFVPPVRALLDGRANLRNHRKLVVTDAGRDSARLWCGGRNLGAEYFEGQDGVSPWCDLSFDLRGEVVVQAAAMFERDWRFATRQSSDARATMQPARQAAVHGAQLLASGPDQAADTFHAMLTAAAYQARERMVLVTPYFVPDAALLSAWCLAARRGVSIDLLVPERSNHWLSDLARNRALRAMAHAGASVHLADGMLHAKLVVVDDCLALAGSANLDTRSLFLNYEAMMAFHDPDDVQRFSAWFEQEVVGTRCYDARNPGALRDVAEGLLLWMAFQL